MDINFLNDGPWYTRPLREFNERITNLMFIFIAAARGAEDFFSFPQEDMPGELDADLDMLTELGGRAESELFRWGLVACWASFEGGMRAFLEDWLRFLTTVRLDPPVEADDPETIIDQMLREERKKRGRSGVDHFSAVAQHLGLPDDFWTALRRNAEGELVRHIREELTLFFALRNLAAHAGPMIADEHFVRRLRNSRYLVGDEILVSTDLFIRLTSATRLFAGAVDGYAAGLGAALEKKLGTVELWPQSNPD